MEAVMELMKDLNWTMRKTKKGGQLPEMGKRCSCRAVLVAKDPHRFDDSWPVYLVLVFGEFLWTFWSSGILLEEDVPFQTGRWVKVAMLVNGD